VIRLLNMGVPAISRASRLQRNRREGGKRLETQSQNGAQVTGMVDTADTAPEPAMDT
jgi:hypothetical protein